MGIAQTASDKVDAAIIDSAYQLRQDLDGMLNDKLDKSSVVQVTGASTTNVMSQKAVTDALNNKLGATANAVSASRLQTARTINGVAFDGTANITVADNTKLPLTGGTLTGRLIGTRGAFTGTGNDYLEGGLEVRGNGLSNTVFPMIGFHQPNMYAGFLQLRGWADFRFYSQGGTAYANVTAAAFIGNGSQLTALDASNLSTGTVAVARGGTGATATTGTGNNVLSDSPALTGVPTVPTAAVGTNSTQIASTAFVHATALGSGQSWQNVTASRARGTTYTNTTGRPIQILVQYQDDPGNVAGATFNIGSLTRTTADLGGGTGHPYWFAAVIPHGTTYSFSGGLSLPAWWELR